MVYTFFVVPFIVGFIIWIASYRFLRELLKQVMSSATKKVVSSWRPAGWVFRAKAIGSHRLLVIGLFVIGAGVLTAVLPPVGIGIWAGAILGLLHGAIDDSLATPPSELPDSVEPKDAAPAPRTTDEPITPPAT